MSVYKSDLQEIYRLLRARTRWTKGENAKDARGRMVEAKSPYAKCWCLEGACELLDIDWWCVQKAMDIRGSLHGWNDTHTHKELLKRLGKAIKTAPVRS